MVSDYSQFEDIFRYSGTYGLYRLQQGIVRYDPYKWIENMRLKINSLENDFWRFLFTVFRGTTEHFVGDLNAAALKKDPYFFLVSSSGFLLHVVRLLFTVNNKFECSGRQIFQTVYALKRIPEDFAGRFESFLREDGGLTLERKTEVAELLATSVIGMEYLLE
jgi:hypothetical protein